MPGLDATGPAGAGQMTGGGRGVCVTDDPEIVTRFIRHATGLGGHLGRRGTARAQGRGMGLGPMRGCWR